MTITTYVTVLRSEDDSIKEFDKYVKQGSWFLHEATAESKTYIHTEVEHGRNSKVDNTVNNL